MHTIPTYWHVKHISDLLFEGKHQVLKKGVQRDRHKTNNEWAMDSDCMKFWKENDATVVTELQSESLSREEKDELYINLQTTLLGAHIEQGDVEVELWDDLNSRHLDQLTSSLRNLVRKERPDVLNYTTRHRRSWTLRKGSKRFDVYMNESCLLPAQRVVILQALSLCSHGS